MNKFAVATMLLTTILLTTACTNYNSKSQNSDIISGSEKNNLFSSNTNNKSSNIVSFPIELVIKDRKEIVVVQIEEESSLQEKVELIVKNMSEESFNGLPIHVTIYGNEMAKIVLKEPTNFSKNNRFSWKKDYLNDQNKEKTINTLVKNILQEQYKGPWIKTVQLYYEDELITLD